MRYLIIVIMFILMSSCDTLQEEQDCQKGFVFNDNVGICVVDTCVRYSEYEHVVCKQGCYLKNAKWYCETTYDNY